MSYVARTFSHTERGTVQMVNLECVTEALKMNGYTNIKVGNTIYSGTTIAIILLPD